MKRFGLYLTKSNNLFPIAFSNVARKGLGFFFQARKLIFFCQMACSYLLNSHGGTQSFDFDNTYFIYNNSYPLLKESFLHTILFNQKSYKNLFFPRLLFTNVLYNNNNSSYRKILKKDHSTFLKNFLSKQLYF